MKTEHQKWKTPSHAPAMYERHAQNQTYDHAE